MSVVVGSMFTGVGALDLAVKVLFPDARFAWMAEKDKKASRVLAERFPDVPNFGDVAAFDWKEAESVDIVVGGFPCQDISKIGNRAGIKKGTRSGLWFEMFDAVRLLRPKVIFLENVATIAAAGGGLDVVLGSLAEAGWDAEWAMLRASDLGAPHQRDRWFCIAWDAARHAALEGLQGRARRGLQHVELGAAVAGTPQLPASERGRDVDWQEYEPAIRHWERIIRRGVPYPLDDGGLHNPDFIEWMMGWPECWTDIPKNSRPDRVRQVGNGVVPLQAAVAFEHLLDRATQPEQEYV